MSFGKWKICRYVALARDGAARSDFPFPIFHLEALALAFSSLPGYKSLSHVLPDVPAGFWACAF
jgi:hypothetical protein